MGAIPTAGRACVLGTLLLAAACLLPGIFAADTPWQAVIALALLYAFCQGPVPPCRRLRLRMFGPAPEATAPVAAGSFFPVLLAAAFLLPPPAAALVAVPGAMLGTTAGTARRPHPTRRVRRIWRAAQLALATWAAARTQMLLGGPVALGGGGYGLTTPDFPYVLLPAGAAALAFCLVLTALDGGILATAERVPVRAAWRGLLPRSLAAHGVHALAGLMMAILWRSPYGPVSALFVLLPMGISGWVFAQYHRERAAHQATIRALVQAVDIKDDYTRGHSERVGRASAMIAAELGMDRHRLEVLRFAGILHDVGKLGVPTRVLRKNGPLTPEERRVIQLHPEYGHEIVRGIAFLGQARSAILYHHERMDGSGYPQGLHGAEIPEFARVVAVADAFDAMTSTRSYSRARPVHTAVAELRRCAGTQFDPEMVAALVRALARHGWETAVTADEADPDAPLARRGPGTEQSSADAARPHDAATTPTVASPTATTPTAGNATASGAEAGVPAGRAVPAAVRAGGGGRPT